jgi:hypothetical protein
LRIPVGRPLAAAIILESKDNIPHREDNLKHSCTLKNTSFLAIMSLCEDAERQRNNAAENPISNICKVCIDFWIVFCIFYFLCDGGIEAR